jgi:hypothetical protein
MMMDFNKFVFQGRVVPHQIRESLEIYLKDRQEPGSCLRAILENNLREACAQADDEIMWNLPVIVAYLYNEIPSECWGSKEKVQRWIDNT